MIPLRPLRVAALIAFAALAVPASIASCTVGEGRFPACRSDTECGERPTAKEAPYCFELRCVACRADTDCQAAHACSAQNVCVRIADTPAGEVDGGPVEKESWEPSTSEDYDRCMAACKNKPASCKTRCGKRPPKKK